MWVRVWRTGTYNDFHLLPRKLGIEDRAAILSSLTDSPRCDSLLAHPPIHFVFPRLSSRVFCREGGYLRKQRQGGGASDIHPRPRSCNLPLSLPLSWGGIAPPSPPPTTPLLHPPSQRPCRGPLVPSVESRGLRDSHFGLGEFSSSSPSRDREPFVHYRTFASTTISRWKSIFSNRVATWHDQLCCMRQTCKSTVVSRDYWRK